MTMRAEWPGAGPAAGLEALRGRSDRKALEAAAREMEALLAYEMVKAMRGTAAGGTGPESGFGKDVYGTLFDMEMARLVAERGLGLREMILRGLDRDAAGEGGRKPQRAAEAPGDAGTAAGEAERDARQGSAAPAPGATEEPPASAAGFSTAAPLAGAARLASPFGLRRDPFTGRVAFHRGLDLAAPAGTPVRPILGGKVVRSGWEPGAGNVIVVDHGNGLETRYAHNAVNLVREGDLVGPETVIARVGSTGRSTGPHLHFEVRRAGVPVDPGSFVANRPPKDSGGSADNRSDGTRPGEGGV